ncbi:hypothetical protein O181_013246 [Austropuccinia psidii MF-1]|uniref:Uncharacterized protein n=1 Tax=Austropuccinia psidii MF-1 TaxID=1389203 RepID=A0A9Q3GN15_9BASI|nr:hypothetical protein [Austropuccinia psidii MF-1]
MSTTRTKPVICSCQTHGCSKLRFKDRHGNWQAGSIVSHGTKNNHALDDAQFEARLEIEDSSDNSESAHLHFSQDQSSDNPNELSGDLSDGVNPQNLHLSSPPSTPNNLESYNTYDCSRFHTFSLASADSMAVHISLLVTILSVFENSSISTSAWLLKSTRDLLTLTASTEFNSSSVRRLKYRENQLLKSVPSDVRSIIRRLAIDPELVQVVCCPHCFAMYPNNSTTPTHCINQTLQTPPFSAASESQIPQSLSSSEDLSRICGTSLFQRCKIGQSPIKTYAYQSFYDWLGRLFSRPGIETALDSSATIASEPFNPDSEAHDIQHSIMWKQFLGPNQTQFTKHSGNLTFGMFMDAINPYGNRQAGKNSSITFIVLVCLSLPLYLRYQPQNLFLVGIAPGPKEPSLEEVNWVLRPIVEQLKVLWDPGLHLSQMHMYPKGRMIFAAILPFFADLPALRRALGFAAPTANRMCSYCLLEKSQINNLDPQTWPLRNLSDHKHWATQSRDAVNNNLKLKILREHGVRYSVMLELPYWDIIKYHVVDAMHNLLLGMLKWHCQRFWCMSDVADEENPKGISTTELMDLLADAAAPLKGLHSNNFTEAETETNEDSGVSFNRLEFRSNESSDDTFSPYLEDGGWGGQWSVPSEGKIIFDKDLLSFINKLLPRIHIPTWIKRALPVLGKASFGRLKADEWRNLFTIQLPLTLPVYWSTGGPSAHSLFRNFAHLVSSVNIALKRRLTSELVSKYRYHNLEYLKSCLILFPEVTLAPNHHMSIHLGDCLEKFGPSRAWWSFSMERLMGRILKASHNNRLGQLEITFLINFCRAGNLQALMSQHEKFPASLRPFIHQLQALHDPLPVKPKFIPKGRVSFLDSPTLNLLIKRINELFPAGDNSSWTASKDWAKKTHSNASNFLSISSNIENLATYSVDEHVYATSKTNPSNSIVKLKNHSNLEYGVIEKIFKHTRTLPNQESKTDVWLKVHPLIKNDLLKKSPFSNLEDYNLQLELRTLDREMTYVIHIDDIVGHCAWIKYRPSEIRQEIVIDCIALVSLER